MEIIEVQTTIGNRTQQDLPNRLYPAYQQRRGNNWNGNFAAVLTAGNAIHYEFNAGSQGPHSEEVLQTTIRNTRGVGDIVAAFSDRIACNACRSTFFSFLRGRSGGNDINFYYITAAPFAGIRRYYIRQWWY